MPILKKLIFAPFFLITFTLLILNLSSIFGSYDFIFSFSFESLIPLLTISVLLTLSGIFLALFISLCQELMFVLPVITLASITPLFIIKPPLGIVMVVGSLITLLITYFSINEALKRYLTFDPKGILGPSVKLMAQILLLTLSLSYFLSINQVVTKDGFQIPDSLLEMSLKLTDQPVEAGKELTFNPSISKEQIDLLRQNPEVLKQSGIDPKLLDSLDQPASQGEDITKEFTRGLVKLKFEQTIKPYLNIIPMILAGLLFITLLSINSLVGIFISPLLWIIFLILEKSGFVKFEVEQRPVKKMII